MLEHEHSERDVEGSLMSAGEVLERLLEPLVERRVAPDTVRGVDPDQVRMSAADRLSAPGAVAAGADVEDLGPGSARLGHPPREPADRVTRCRDGLDGPLEGLRSHIP